ncbi:TetR/AcrR family transcriptional regulator [Glacieibacterium frigidum]|uniref:TetR/AcrR family transcriptional regulator n=1 Tax=Glacieibacterium frigidum TaxID=2593303 RepID=A0A552U9P1_9SPHN|nr:TetR/AcrR family transcriptional regulator [Glacieibacterium frigidum]TRW14933.1 TetR/AcrR family transcriptional regulator [Glacieibacterium frigidum]
MAKAAEIVEFAKGKDRLIRTAMALFAEKGFDGVTVRDLAAAAEVSVGLINHHFGSKEGLREAVDRYFLAQFEEAITDRPLNARDAETRGMDAVVEWTEQWIDRHVGDWDLSKAYMRRALLEGSDWGAHLFERFYQVARTTVDRMDAEGRLRPEVDRLWLPLLIIYMELGTLMLEPFVEKVLGRSGYDRALWRRRYLAYIDLIARGTRPDPAPEN